MKFTLAGLIAFWPVFGLLTAIGHPIIGAIIASAAVYAVWWVMNWVEDKPKFRAKGK